MLTHSIAIKFALPYDEKHRKNLEDMTVRGFKDKMFGDQNIEGPTFDEGTIFWWGRTTPTELCFTLWTDDPLKWTERMVSYGFDNFHVVKMPDEMKRRGLGGYHPPEVHGRRIILALSVTRPKSLFDAQIVSVDEQMGIVGKGSSCASSDPRSAIRGALEFYNREKMSVPAVVVHDLSKVNMEECGDDLQDWGDVWLLFPDALTLEESALALLQ